MVLVDVITGAMQYARPTTSKRRTVRVPTLREGGSRISTSTFPGNYRSIFEGGRRPIAINEILTSARIAAQLLSPATDVPIDNQTIVERVHSAAPTHNYAPYIDAEVGKRAVEITELKRKLNESESEVNRLKKEVERIGDKRYVSNRSDDNSIDSLTRNADVNNRSDSREQGEARASNARRQAGKETELRREVDAGQSFVATAYVADCDTGCIGVTATGVDVSNTTTHNGRTVIAVDPSVIPFGTNLRIKAGGQVIEGVASDSGGDIVGNRIDVLVSDVGTARHFGRQSVSVEILD